MKKIYLAICLLAVFAMQPAEAQKRKKGSKKKVVRKATSAPKLNTSATPKRTDTLNQSLLLCYTMYDMPSWYLAVNKDFRFPVDMQQPAFYRLATINDTLFTNYLAQVPYEIYSKKITLPLYVNNSISCKEFLIQRVVTMDSALQAKYPELMSFKAVEDSNPLNTARIDCDGKSTRIVVQYDGETYFVNPFMFNKKMYYACYSKNDPNFIKQSFE